MTPHVESWLTPVEESGVVSFRTSSGLPFRSHRDSGLVFSVHVHSQKQLDQWAVNVTAQFYACW